MCPRYIQGKLGMVDCSGQSLVCFAAFMPGARPLGSREPFRLILPTYLCILLVHIRKEFLTMQLLLSNNFITSKGDLVFTFKFIVEPKS